jgi:hypothetical protein
VQSVTPSSGSALLVLAKVTVVKIVNYTKYIGVQLAILTTVTLTSTSNALPDDGVTDCTETCRSNCFNGNFNVKFKIVFKTIHLVDKIKL